MQDLLQSWTIKDNKLTSYNISLGKLKRDITVAERDIVRDLVYLGTTSGDILKVSLDLKIIQLKVFWHKCSKLINCTILSVQPTEEKRKHLD